MTEIDEFKAKLRGEVESAMERIREMQDQAAEQYREMQFELRDLPRPESPDPGGHPALGRGVRRVLAGRHTGRDRA